MDTQAIRTGRDAFKRACPAGAGARQRQPRKRPTARREQTPTVFVMGGGWWAPSASARQYINYELAQQKSGKNRRQEVGEREGEVGTRLRGVWMGGVFSPIS